MKQENLVWFTALVSVVVATGVYILPIQAYPLVITAAFTAFVFRSDAQWAIPGMLTVIYVCLLGLAEYEVPTVEWVIFGGTYLLAITAAIYGARKIASSNDTARWLNFITILSLLFAVIDMTYMWEIQTDILTFGGWMVNLAENASFIFEVVVINVTFAGLLLAGYHCLIHRYITNTVYAYQEGVHGPEANN